MKKDNLEVWSWILQRITAVFLIFGMIMHFWILHYIDIEHKSITFALVQERLQSLLWIIFDLLLLIAALYHALNGIWSIVLDWNPRKLIRKCLGWSLSVIGVVALVIGIYILIPFT